MQKVIIIILLAIAGISILAGLLFYFFQEKVIFYPGKLSQDYKFRFRNEFEEINIPTSDGHTINSLLFRANNTKGLIFYLHGNADGLNVWGGIAEVYTALGYDIFMPDYRGYGKSTGSIYSEEQMHNDMQLAYDKMKELYGEDRIVVMGFSIGTGMASRLAANNSPRMLIMQAPYYSLKELIRDIAPIAPPYLIRYKLENYKYLPQCSMPVTIFHGDKDEVININSSLRLKEYLKPTDSLIVLKGTGHNQITFNVDYIRRLKEILQTNNEISEKTHTFAE